MLKVCFVSTYPPIHCGIASYTHSLAKALIEVKPIQVTVVTEKGGMHSLNEVVCIPCFSRGTDYVEDVLQPITETKPDIVHIQHDYSVYGFGDLFFKLLEKIDRNTVITMHEIHTPATPEKITYGVENLSRNHARLGRIATKLIVHTETMKKWLCEYNVEASRIEIVPHGTSILPEVHKIEAKRALGFSEFDRVILSLGFIRRSKNESLLIEALPEILKKVPRTRLLLVGSLHLHSPPEDIEEAQRRRSITHELGLDPYVRFIERYVGEEELTVILGCADVLVYLHDKPYAEVSGALHLGMGAGKPIVATAIPRYEEIQRISPETVLDPGDKTRLADILSKILTGTHFANELARRVVAYARQTSWMNIANEHHRIYQDAQKRG